MELTLPHRLAVIILRDRGGGGGYITGTMTGMPRSYCRLTVTEPLAEPVPSAFCALIH